MNLKQLVVLLLSVAFFLGLINAYRMHKAEVNGEHIQPLIEKIIPAKGA